MFSTRLACAGHSPHNYATHGDTVVLGIGNVMRIGRSLVYVIAMIALAAFIGVLKSGLHRLFREGFWLGAAGSLVCVGVIIAFTVYNRPAVTDANEITHSPKPEIEELVARFPGPIILEISKAKWWLMIVLGSVMTIASVFVAVIAFQAMSVGQSGAGVGFAISVFGILFFGLAPVLGANLIHDGSLQIDGNGFSFRRLFRKRYRWTEVTNFGVARSSNAGVVFKTSKQGRNIWARINAFYADGRDGRLPETYGLQAEELVQLMTAWQSSAAAPQSDDYARRPGFRALAADLGLPKAEKPLTKQ